MNETDALLALNMLPKVGPVRVRRLMEACGGAVAVLRMTGPKWGRKGPVQGPDSARMGR